MADESRDMGGAEASSTERRRASLVEAILDNLPAWAFIALAVAALYMVWATLVVLETYVGELPAVEP
jgi:hypothetical protein